MHKYGRVIDRWIDWLIGWLIDLLINNYGSCILDKYGTITD